MGWREWGDGMIDVRNWGFGVPLVYWDSDCIDVER